MTISGSPVTFSSCELKPTRFKIKSISLMWINLWLHWPSSSYSQLSLSPVSDGCDFVRGRRSCLRRPSRSRWKKEDKSGREKSFFRGLDRRQKSRGFPLPLCKVFSRRIKFLYSSGGKLRWEEKKRLGHGIFLKTGWTRAWTSRTTKNGETWFSGYYYPFLCINIRL